MARLQVALAVNEELILLYWGIGREILERQSREGWRSRVIGRLGTRLSVHDRVVSARNLKSWALSLNYKTQRIHNRDSPVAKIYISATYSDLKAYRDAVYRILRKLRHDVISMEDYVATDQYPLRKCLADVAACDIYVGLIGWRYGYIPGQDNPQDKSITELEYRKAGEAKISRLLFLVDNDAAWPDASKDAVTGEAEAGGRIAALRAEMVKFQQRYQMRHGIWLNPFHRLGFRSSERPQNSAPFSSSILGAEFPRRPVAFLPRNRTHRAG